MPRWRPRSDLAAAWREWDEWCIRTRHARWRSSKHSHTPPRDREVAVAMIDAVSAEAGRLGVSSETLRRTMLSHRHAGLDHFEAVEAAIRELS